jgi:flavin-dependent dehydrogenase
VSAAGNAPAARYDALVIGAGPAGTSAAAILAEYGRRVLILERERFPRYRIGESLIPHCWFALNRLGLVERLDAADFAVHKYSVQFASVDGRVSKPYYFFERSDHPSSRTWQVVRADFDQFLLDNALRKGAECWQETTARELLRDGERVVGVRVERAGAGELELHAPMTIDASGRDTFAQQKHGWRVQDLRLKKHAIWTYYRGALRDPGLDAGATTIAYVPTKGWFWYIPQAGDVVSVGIVADKEYLFRDTKDIGEIFRREAAAQPWVARHLAPGTPTGVYKATHDFTYRSMHCAADGLLLAGDAFAFLDPVFSSGVFLALNGGVMAGDAVERALRSGDVSAPQFAAYADKYRHGMESMRRLVHAFYDAGFNFGEFLRAHPDMRGDITDVLIGDLFRDFDPLFRAMADFADIPGPLPHGAPLVRSAV